MERTAYTDASTCLRGVRDLCELLACRPGWVNTSDLVPVHVLLDHAGDLLSIGEAELEKKRAAETSRTGDG